MKMVGIKLENQIEKYKNIRFLSAFRLSKFKFEMWTLVVWTLRFDYLSGKRTEIFPCMYGEFYHKDEKFVCDKNGITKV